MTTTGNMRPNGIPFTNANGALNAYMDIKSKTGVRSVADQFGKIVDSDNDKKYKDQLIKFHNDELQTKKDKYKSDADTKRRADTLAQAKEDREYASKVKTFRTYLKANNIDDSKFLDDDIYFGGDTIVKAHNDPSDFKFSRTYQMKDGKIVAEYKNKKGELNHKVIFDAGSSSSNSKDDTGFVSQDGKKFKSQKELSDYLMGQTKKAKFDIDI